MVKNVLVILCVQQDRLDKLDPCVSRQGAPPIDSVYRGFTVCVLKCCSVIFFSYLLRFTNDCLWRLDTVEKIWHQTVKWQFAVVWHFLVINQYFCVKNGILDCFGTAAQVWQYVITYCSGTLLHIFTLFNTFYKVLIFRRCYFYMKFRSPISIHL